MTVYTSKVEYGRQRRVPWWVVLLTGIAALILGFLLLTEPGMTTLALVQFLGVYWFVAGIFSIVEIFLNSHNWGWKLVLGIIGILAGITILRHPVTSAIFIPSLIVIFVAIEGIIFGFVSVVRAFSEHSWGMGILGALSVVFGFLILFSPQVATLALPVVIGILAIVGGIVAIVNSSASAGQNEHLYPAGRRPHIRRQFRSLARMMSRSLAQIMSLVRKTNNRTSHEVNNGRLAEKTGYL